MGLEKDRRPGFFPKGLEVRGNSTFSTAADVTFKGGVTFLGAVTLPSSGLGVTFGDPTTFSDTVRVAKLATMSSGLSVAGNSTFGGTVKSAKLLTASSGVSVAGNSTFTGTVKSSKLLTASSGLSVAGASTFAKLVKASSGLSVAGASTFAKLVKASSNLSVAGASTFAKTVTASSNLHVDGTAHFDGASTFSAAVGFAAGVTFKDAVTLSTGGSLRQHVQALTEASTGTAILNYGVTTLTVTGSTSVTAGQLIYTLSAPVAGVEKAILVDNNSTRDVIIRTPSSEDTFYGSTKNSFTYSTNASDPPVALRLVGLSSVQWGIISGVSSTAAVTIAGATA